MKYWWWEIESWLCEKGIRPCAHCRAELRREIVDWMRRRIGTEA